MGTHLPILPGTRLPAQGVATPVQTATASVQNDLKDREIGLFKRRVDYLDTELQRERIGRVVFETQLRIAAMRRSLVDAPVMFALLTGAGMGVGMIIRATYDTVLVGKYGATLGKLACGLRVVMPDGGKVTYMRAFGRYWGEVVTGLTIGIGYIIAAFDDEKRALHDRICNTRVVKK